ncbi:MAG: hypothetical protein IPP56_03385 [Bacteroidetes bacterium]|nr:hypothetical protein [Bacteroidota bacterium]MBK9671685.1 hypothetical protein [Bacteroidota bacterium]MBK9798791.1 hypothetical protein [Bacteroidota bacterium]MBP6412873.1 hypothetical protein [Bacteroidia bacterium]
MATEGIIKEGVFDNLYKSIFTLCFAKSHGILDSLRQIKKFYRLKFRYRNFTIDGTNIVVTCRRVENEYSVYFGCLETVIDK